MFLGEFKHTIDDKGRLTIPAKYRGDLAAGLVITRGFDKNLSIYTMTGWEKLAASVMNQSVSSTRIRDLRRRLFSAATDLQPDKQGRILIPPQLREFAGVDGGTVVIAGMYDFIEIWSADVWSNRRVQIENPDDDAYWEDIGIWVQEV